MNSHSVEFVESVESNNAENKSLSLLNFQALKDPVKLIGCEELFPIFSNIFRDMEITMTDVTRNQSSVISIEKSATGYRRVSPWLQKPAIFHDPFDAACDCTVDLIHAFVADNPGYLCLHTAAARFNKGLVLFPSFYRTGKSTLSVHLASQGIQLFTDDALPVTADDNKGFVLGIYPRLRLPLPENGTEAFRTFVDKRAGLSNKRSCYIKLDTDELARYGTTASICGVTILRRDETLPAKLEEVEKDEVIKEMILRNFARQNPALDIVDRICTIVEKAQCYKLTYSNLYEATKILKNRFK